VTLQSGTVALVISKSDFLAMAGSLNGGRLEAILESLEKVVAIVGPSCSFRVILHAERVFVTMFDARNGVVIRIAMSDFKAIR
jgi:hypothetical protein